MNNLIDKENMLRAEIESKQYNLYIRDTRLSIGEFLSMYQEDELDFFETEIPALTQAQKTRIVEAILFGFPLPVLQFVQPINQKLLLLNKASLIFTIASFVGVLKPAHHKNGYKNNWALDGATVLTNLNAYTWETLSQKFRFQIKRTAINAEIFENIRLENDAAHDSVRDIIVGLRLDFLK
jgi:hypothetical protein